MKHKVIYLEETEVGKDINWVTIEVPLNPCTIDGKLYPNNLEIVEYVIGTHPDTPDVALLNKRVDELIETIKLMVEEKDILPLSTGGLNITQCVPLTMEDRYVIHISVLGSITQEVLEFKYNLKKDWGNN